MSSLHRVCWKPTSPDKHDVVSGFLCLRPGTSIRATDASCSRTASMGMSKIRDHSTGNGAKDTSPGRLLRQKCPWHRGTRVSLRPVAAWESALQGGKLSAFYSICGIAKHSTSPIPTRNKAAFLAIGVPELPITIPICAR